MGYAVSPEMQAVLFGHEEAEQTLLNLWNKKTLSGSWIFSGPKGVGKATLAYRLARFIFAQNGESDFFGEAVVPTSLKIDENNSAFKAVALRTFPDLKIVERTLKEEELKSRQAVIDSGKALDAEVEKERKRYDEIRVSDIRDACDFLRRTSAVGGWRVMIIDSADEMNANAANALLKSLEEPPPQTLIILISHNPGRLLPTVRSRCRRLVLKPLENQVMEKFLEQNLGTVSEKHSLALLSEGSPGMALFLAENEGLRLFESLLGLFKNFPDFSILALYEFSEKTLKDKEKMRSAQNMLVYWLSRVCIRLSGKGGFENILPQEAEVIQRMSLVLHPVELMNILEEIMQTFQDVDLDQKQVFVNACLKLQKGS